MQGVGTGVTIQPNGRKVIVVGAANVDTVVRVPRVPEAGETVLATSATTTGGGKGANQAVVAATLGAPTWFVGCVGDDRDGVETRRALASVGVDIHGLATVPAPTGRALVFVAEDGENSIAVIPGANSLLTAARTRAALADIDGDAVLVVSLEVPLVAVLEAARTCRQRGWTLVLNPAPAQPLPDELVGSCAVITPNASELLSLGDPESLLERGALAVVVTRGAQGARLHRHGFPPEDVPAAPATVVDTTGAGDAFTAGLAVRIASGADLADAVAWATVVGAIATEGVGARGSLPTPARVGERLTR